VCRGGFLALLEVSDRLLCLLGPSFGLVGINDDLAPECPEVAPPADVMRSSLPWLRWGPGRARRSPTYPLGAFLGYVPEACGVSLYAREPLAEHLLVRGFALPVVLLALLRLV